MFEFKRKYLDDSLEPLAVFWLTRYYPIVILLNYRNLHNLRNILSPIGVNFFILGYVLIGLVFILQEVLICDPAIRHFMLIVLATHMLYDFLLNMELLRIVSCSETEHYNSEWIFYDDQLTFEQRIEKLEQQGKWKEVKRVKRIQRHSHGIDRLKWLGEVRICEKGTSNCWLIRFTDGNDYESYASRFNTHDSYAYLLSVFQEVRDRGLSPQRRQQVLKRLERVGVKIQPCCIQNPISGE